MPDLLGRRQHDIVVRWLLLHHLLGLDVEHAAAYHREAAVVIVLALRHEHLVVFAWPRGADRLPLTLVEGHVDACLRANRRLLDH